MATLLSFTSETNSSRTEESIMYSDSSSPCHISVRHRSEYDVFLSFRGEDVRGNFVVFLCDRLEGAKVDVFLDSKKIRASEEIHPTLMQAIDRSIISIPIFSKDYASSRSCLMEVEKIYKCMRTKGQIVLPIFYEVEPSDVRNQQGTFMESFRKHQDNGIEPDVLDCWREALREIGYIKGYTMSGDLAALLQQVVSRVSEILGTDDVPVPQYLVGMDQRVQALVEKLQVSSTDVRIVGICGMHGIGKTTLAEVVYNKLHSQFDASSFISDIHTRYESEGIVSLQRQLIKDLLKRDFEGPRTFECHIKMIQNKFRDTKVLIVLDEVESAYQIKAFGVTLNCFGLGSRIILTMRKPELLDVAEAPRLYNMEVMDEHHACQLFYRYAFGKCTPDREYTALSVDIVANTGGIPLAITSLGSYLSGNTEVKIWEEVLQKLKNCEYEPLEKALRISYSNLTQKEKEIYLDIACFLAGESNDIACHMWRDCEFYPFQGIKKLLHLSLVKIEENNKLWMSNPGREFGKTIVSQKHTEPRMRSRLWIHDEAMDVLKGRKGTDNIKAMCLQFDSGLDEHLTNIGKPGEAQDQTATSSSFGKFGKLLLRFLKLYRKIPTYLYFPLCFFFSRPNLATPPYLPLLTAKNFTGLSELRFLRLDRARITGDFRGLLSKLRWLDWKNCPEFREGLENLFLENLVILDLSWSNVTQDWRGWRLITEKAKKLKVLLLASCNHLRESPIFSHHWQLKMLNFENCSRLISISIPSGTIETLEYLNIKGCSDIIELPQGLRSMVALEKLIIDKTSIREFNAGSQMNKLLLLSACGCRHLRVIDNSICELKSLSSLALDESAIAELPDSIGSLTMLQTLSLRNCREVDKLPSSIGHLKSLVEMDLSYTAVTELPSAVEGLKSLQVLVMEGTYLKEFPKAITRLQSLERIDFSRCRCMRGRIPDDINSLSSLKTLMLSSTNIYSLPRTTSELCQLQVLDLHMCQKLQHLQSLPRSLTSLRAGSQHMCGIPDLSYMTKLMELHLADNSDQHLEPSISVTVSKPWPADSFQWIANLSRLETLELHISKITELPPVFDGLEKLRKLVFSCLHLECLPRLPSSLTTLRLQYCKSLIHENLCYLTCLSKLELIDCAVESINLRGLTELQLLEISDCGLLKEIIGIQGLTCLKKLTLSKCPQFQRDNLQILQEKGLEIVE